MGCERYAIHHKCDYLYCLVYDLKGFIKNPYGLENDLYGIKNGMYVKVIIVPKF